MRSNFSCKIALRYLWTRRAEAFITIITIISILGVAIGVMVLNIVMAVMTGFESTLQDKILNTNSHVVVRSLDGLVNGWQEKVEVISKLPGISSVSAFTQHQALIRTRDRSSGILIRGVTPGSSAAQQLESYLGSGSKPSGEMQLFDPPPILIEDEQGGEKQVKLPAIIIGRELSRSMGLYIGMPVSILAPQTSSSPFGLVPRFRRFVVAGIYSSGLVEYESGLAYASLEEAQRFFGSGAAVSGLEVRLKDIHSAPLIAKKIIDTLGGLASGLYSQDWTEVNKPLWDAIKLEKKVYFLVLLLIVVMASFSIITTLVMLVLEKRKDIAILKTMGAGSRAIGRIFIIQGATIGALGT
ncbi:MAG: lipoprotein-releasing system transmembrane subunit LolC, partial [Proteobacteria bacterium]